MALETQHQANIILALVLWIWTKGMLYIYKTNTC